MSNLPTLTKLKTAIRKLQSELEALCEKKEGLEKIIERHEELMHTKESLEGLVMTLRAQIDHLGTPLPVKENEITTTIETYEGLMDEFRKGSSLPDDLNRIMKRDEGYLLAAIKHHAMGGNFFTGYSIKRHFDAEPYKLISDYPAYQRLKQTALRIQLTIFEQKLAQIAPETEVVSQQLEETNNLIAEKKQELTTSCTEMEKLNHTCSPQYWQNPRAAEATDDEQEKYDTIYPL